MPLNSGTCSQDTTGIRRQHTAVQDAHSNFVDEDRWLSLRPIPMKPISHILSRPRVNQIKTFYTALKNIFKKCHHPFNSLWFALDADYPEAVLTLISLSAAQIMQKKTNLSNVLETPFSVVQCLFFYLFFLTKPAGLRRKVTTSLQSQGLPAP